MIMQKYSVCGVGVELEGSDPQQLQNINRLWHQLFALQDGLAGTEPSVKLRFGSALDSGRPMPSGQRVFKSETLEILRTEAGYHFQCHDSQLAINLAGNQAVGRLSNAFWNLPVQDQREFFLLSFVILLRGHDRYGLHANGLIREEQGILIVGESGAGKTTLTLGLMSQGWHLLSDDAIMLRRAERGIEALALRRGFSCTRQTANHFSGLIDTEAVFPGSFSASCRPRAIIFPRISHQSQSQLVPMGESEAIFSLIAQSPGIMTEQPWAARQLELLQQLVSQASSYRLLSGSDVFEDPESVSRQLRDTLKEASWAK